MRIKSLNIILQTLGSIDPNNENEFVSKTPPPLLMFSVDNFLLEQTNEEWKTVPVCTLRQSFYLKKKKKKKRALYVASRSAQVQQDTDRGVCVSADANEALSHARALLEQG